MRKFRFALVILVIVAILLMGGNIIYLNYISSADTYKEDVFLQSETNKTALIIVAHDDDAISMSGTISYLCDNGWDVRELCFYQGWEDKDSIRKRDLESAVSLLGMKSVEYYDIELRKGRDKIEKPWLPIPYSDFDSSYNREIAHKHIENFIFNNKPSVIFTLDDIMGGYGHPDHVVISKLILDFCMQHQNDSAFSVERIYQAVFDPEMNERILKDMEAFKLAKKVYKVETSPKPNVYLSLKGREVIKKQALLTYPTEQNSLTKIWPYYNYYPANIYFKIFNKEYYRVLKKNENYR
ncbi:MAG: PIG-L family deacetylase [Saprospiraceae bacterium]|nr:PIG-L family deacetylase [Saprospiraceae bacterium]